MMFQRRHPVDMTPAELAAMYLAADEARWLAEEHGLSSYWEVARVLSDALPKPIAEHMEFCWAYADVVAQEIEGDAGYYRRLLCHTAYLREDTPRCYAAIVDARGERPRRRAPARWTRPPEPSVVRAGFAVRRRDELDRRASLRPPLVPVHQLVDGLRDGVVLTGRPSSRACSGRIG